MIHKSHFKYVGIGIFAVGGLWSVQRVLDYVRKSMEKITNGFGYVIGKSGAWRLIGLMFQPLLRRRERKDPFSLFLELD